MLLLAALASCFLLPDYTRDWDGYVQAYAEGICACAPDGDNPDEHTVYPFEDVDEEECINLLTNMYGDIDATDWCADREEYRDCLDLIDEAIEDCDPESLHPEEQCNPGTLFTEDCED